MYHNPSYRLRNNPLIALTNALIPTNLRILPLPLLHQSLQLRIIVLRNRLRRHPHHTSTTSTLDALLNLLDRLLQRMYTYILLQTLTRQYVERR